MRLTKFSPRLVLGISVLLGFYNCSVFVSGVPQWVWNPEAITAPISQQGGGGSTSNTVVFDGQNTVSDKDKEKIPIEIVDTQARLFPTIISAISNSLNGGGHRPGGSSSSSSSSSSSGGSGSSSYPGGGGSSSSGGSGGSNSGTSASCNGGSCMCTGSVSGACVGSAIASQAINQGIGAAGNNIASNPSIFGNFLQNFLGGSGSGSASTLPAGLPGGFGGGSSSNKEPEGSCTCVDSNSCFLPSKPSGNCDGGSRVRCCSTTRGTRTYFPDEEDRLSNVRTVTRSQIRRQLFRNIVRGSGSLIDDTLDLVLHPFLTKEDQVKVATRLLRDS